MYPRITILGCGLSGMITALGFASHNIATTIIEGRSSNHKDFFSDIRTTALTSYSKSFLKSIGIWDGLAKISGPFNDIYVADNKAPQMLHFTSSELEADEVMGYLIQNTDFKKALFGFVSASKLINVIEDSSYEITKNTSQECELILNGKTEYKCDLLIVCDGQRSKARQKYFSSDIKKSYNQHAITFIVYHEKLHEGTAVEHFMPTGPFAILPLKDQNFSSIVWTIGSDKKDAIINLPKAEFTYLVQQNFGEFLGNIEIKGKIAAFPLIAYETKQYYNKKIVLVADTAHIVHPLAGQGLNQGIKDIEALILLVLEYGASDYMLAQYQKLRRRDNNNMLEITDAINLVFSNQSKLLHSVRQAGFKIIEQVSPFKKLLIKYAMGKR